MRLCRHCSIIEHELDKDECINYLGDYYCSLGCFNAEVNYDSIEALENEIQNLDSRVEELKSEVRDLEDAESERDNYYDNLVEIKAKIEEVYALVECAESFKALDHTISYLIEYFNDEVSGL